MGPPGVSECVSVTHGRHVSSARHTASPRSTPAATAPPWNSAVPSSPLGCRCVLWARHSQAGDRDSQQRRESSDHAPGACCVSQKTRRALPVAVPTAGCGFHPPGGETEAPNVPGRRHGGGASPVGLGAVPKPVGLMLCHCSEGRTWRTCPLPGACSVRPP